MSKSITINGVDYAPTTTFPTGNRHIVVLDRGWIFVGDLVQSKEDGVYELNNAQNVRKWSDGGFGGLTKDPVGAGAVLDSSAAIRFSRSACIFMVPVPEEWGE
ncbi:MAG: hypothetical protein ACE5FA_00095 [Dehalococcoidia bacterium]